MNHKQLIEIMSISSGTIALITGLKNYNDQDLFVNWLAKPIFDDILMGELANYGNNNMDALQNAYKIYIRHGNKH